MSCERTCRDECKMIFDATFTINENQEQVDIPDKNCYDEEMVESMTAEEIDTCDAAKSDAKDPGVCHVMLTSNDENSILGNQSEIKNKDIHCHLPNYNDGDKYYSKVSGKINSEKEKCIKECHTTCKMCWTKDNCVPVCQMAKEYQLEGFSPVECPTPFYFCNADLSTNTYSVISEIKDENGNEKKMKITYPFHVGTCSVDPALPVFFSIVILLLLMFVAYKLRNQIRSCLGRN